MKKSLSILLCLCTAFTLTACGSAATGTGAQATSAPDADALPKPAGNSEGSNSLGGAVKSEPASDENSIAQTKILVAFFSRADENYAVGVIEKGNTQIIAEIIAEETGGELFHIERETPYPANYEECTDEAKTEQNSSARPALKEDIDISGYDVIFLGYPNWWGDMPMPVYTFLEAHDFTGKTIVPFCTHAGSGLSRTARSIKDAAGAAMLDGLSILGTTAQNKQDEAREAVKEWLGKLNLPE